MFSQIRVIWRAKSHAIDLEKVHKSIHVGVVLCYVTLPTNKLH